MSRHLTQQSEEKPEHTPETMTIALMVAEKPSLAESIAKILSDGKYKSRRGIASSCPVHEYMASLFGKPTEFKITSVAGHVFSIDFPKQFNNWDSVEPIDLFEAETIKNEANPKGHLIKHLANEAKNVDYLILWLDCDREGENICFVFDSLITLGSYQYLSNKDETREINLK